jgi:hypothetical protein
MVKGFENFDGFKEQFQKTSSEAFIVSAAAEVWVAWRIQQIRYRYLKLSALFILLAFLVLVVALLSVILR